MNGMEMRHSGMAVHHDAGGVSCQYEVTQDAEPVTVPREHEPLIGVIV